MLQVFHPPPDAAHWIDAAVIVRLGSTAGPSHFPALPHAMLTMRLVHPAHPFLAAPVLQPPFTFHTLSTRPAAYPHAGEVTAMGLLVRPAAAACLLGHAGGAVADEMVAWSTLAGAHEAARAEEAVDGSGTDIERLRALMASFRRTMAAVSRGRDASHARLCDAVGRHGAQAGEHLGLGRRQLERHCHAILGVAPKQFQRLVRFHKALSIAVTAGASRMAEVALDTGFCDQSHLARDARQLAGVPMSTLLAAARPDSPWWPLAARRSMPAPAPSVPDQPGARSLPWRHHR
jgi:AraC-like DNA-binding protein